MPIEGGPSPFDLDMKHLKPFPKTYDEWLEAIAASLQNGDQPLQVAQEALKYHPTGALVLHLAAFAAIREEKPDLGLTYLKRLMKRYRPFPADFTCQAIALAQSGQWPLAKGIVDKHRLLNIPPRAMHLPPVDARWVNSWIRRIHTWQPEATAQKKRRTAPAPPPPAHRQQEDAQPLPVSDEAATPNPAPLPRVSPRISLSMALPDAQAYAVLDEGHPGNVGDFFLRKDFSHIALLKGFDELLCIPHLKGVDHYWYQVETARKVLKQFRGRVLLADEVGLGKTIEAGIVLKEYLLRGMAERVLILTPPSLVGQWQEEMASKFAIDFITVHDPLLRQDPDAFWSNARIIASISTARRPLHFPLVTQQAFDLVIVDEAHHLKNRASRNWGLVDALRKRFLLMLSATPVQNNLVELYTILTLLKPGLFQTESEFRARYMKPRHPRSPVNRAHLRDLMRSVMIRNTRALVNVKLPPRQALTIRLEPSAEENACYQELSNLIRRAREEEPSLSRMAMHHLLEAAGSSPAAISASLHRLLEKTSSDPWRGLWERYTALPRSSKVDALMDVIERNPGEKKMVFVRFRETLELLDRILRNKGCAFARFDGQMSGVQKDEAIEQFRSQLPILLCTETGGEGRNVQFCNTIINFDLPWNPQVIEQRIGRVHRIGQTREVFVFNLATRGTVEDKILAILDEKINMFELVVGEIQSILGELDDEGDFAGLVFNAWVEATEGESEKAFQELEHKLLRARGQHEEAKALDDALFGEDFEVV